MFCRVFYLSFLVPLLSFVCCQAAIIQPGDAGLATDVFTWNATDTDSTFAHWNSFNDFPGGPTIGNFGFLPAGTSPTSQQSFANGGTANSLTFLSNQSITSGGNAYGGLFGPGDNSSFITDAFTTVRSGTSGGDYSRVVVQFDTLGSELDYGSILLSPSVATEGTIVPDFVAETDRQSLGGQFGGTGVSYLALWDLDTSQAEYRIDFNASGSSMSLNNFRVDSLTQNAAFITPTAVPEPSSVAVIAMIVGGLSVQRWKRKRESSLIELNGVDS